MPFGDDDDDDDDDDDLLTCIILCLMAWRVPRRSVLPVSLG